MEVADALPSDPAAAYRFTDGLPSARVGAVLAAYRRAVCLSRRAVATESGVESRRLKAFETGRSRISDADLVRLAAVYEVEVEELLPPRRAVEIDMEAATLRLGDDVHAVGESSGESYVLESDVLRKYLELLYELRNAPRSRPLPLRDDDLSALADALGREPEVIERRLMDLMDVSREDAASMRRLILRRRVAMPAAGLMLGAGIISGLHATSAAGDGGGGGGTDQSVEIGDAIVIERGDDEPTVRGGDGNDADAADDDGTSDDEVEIGDAIVIERGDEEPTIRE